jgi:hypothetical protein
LIKEGERKGVWNFKREDTRNDVKPVTTVTPPAPVAEQPAKKPEPGPVAVAETKAPVQAPVTSQPEAKPAPAPTSLERRPGENLADSVKRVQSEVKTKEPVANRVWLRETEYIYKETRETSQRTWQFLRGTELTVVAIEGEWLRVKDHQGRGGYVLQKVVSATPLVVGVNEPKVKSSESKVETK